MITLVNKLKAFGPLFVIIAALLWSLDGLLRVSLYSLPPATIVFYEHILGAVVLLLLSKFWIFEPKKLTKNEWIAIGMVALFSGALGTMLYTGALQLINYTQYSVVVLLQQLQPIWAVSMAAFLLKEKITKQFAVWALVALVAAYFISFKDLTVNLATGSGTVKAALFALGAGMMWGSSTAISKYVLNKVSVFAGTAMRFLFTPIFAFIIITVNGQTATLSQVTPAQWNTLLLITFSTGMVALWIYYYGLKLTPARITTLCELVWPASAIIIDYVYFNKTLSFTQILGIVMLLIAIYQVTRPLAKEGKGS